MLNYITEQPLTEPLVEEFLQAELKAGASPNSVKRYRGDLVQLRRFLGEDAVVRRGTLQAWMQSMQQAGYAPRTVCARIDTANRFLYQLGVPELCQQPPRCAIQPTLAMTKEEYAALLETAKTRSVTGLRCCCACLPRRRCRCRALRPLRWRPCRPTWWL